MSVAPLFRLLSCRAAVSWNCLTPARCAMTSFGAILKRERTARGWTQVQLADYSGVPIGTVRDYEQDKRDPGLGAAKKLAQAIGVSLDVLAGICEASGSPPPENKKPGKTAAKKKAK